MLLCTCEEYVLSRVPVNSISAYSHEQAELQVVLRERSFSVVGLSFFDNWRTESTSERTANIVLTIRNVET